jgi:putative membrane protein
MISRRAAGLVGGAVLAAAWFGPLPALATEYFRAHMAMHVSVVALAAPLLARGIAGTVLDPTSRWPLLGSALTVSLLDLLVIWTWHLPALHHLSRHHSVAMMIEQGLFLACSLLLWLSASSSRALAGVGALLMTSMHMTLLGALLTLSPRLLYGHAQDDLTAALNDQQIGGLLMLFGAGTSYLLGAAVLMMSLLSRRPRLT